MKKKKLLTRIFHRRRKKEWYYHIPAAIFWLQFLFSVYLAWIEVRASCVILSQDICPANQDLMVYHYFKMMVILPMILLSFVFILIEFWSKWNWSFEREIVEVCLILGWIMFGIMSLFLNPI